MIKWHVEEAVALFDLYFKQNNPLSPCEEDIQRLSKTLLNRAQLLGFNNIDDKFRNENGLRIQLACIHYVITDGREGMSNASQLFYQTYELWISNRAIFDRLLNEFHSKYQN